MADELDNQPEAEVTEAPEQPQQDLEPEEKALAEQPETPEQPENPEQPTGPQPEQQEQPQLSRRAVKRLEKLEAVADQIRNSGRRPQQQYKGQGIDYQKLIEAEPEVYNQLTKASQEYGQAQYESGLQQANSVRFHTRLEIDAPRVEGKYAQLNQESQDFSPELATAVNKFYLGMVGYDPNTDTVQNPNLRYSDFVDAIAELGEAMFSTKTTQTTQNIARQAANAGLRPDGSSAKTPLNLNKAPEDMSPEELKAAINASMPRDGRGRFLPQK